MKKLIVILFIVSLLILSGCAKKEESLCKTPYFEYKTGECCLDINSNQICDNDEIIEESEEEEQISIESPETIARKFAKVWEAGEYSLMYDFFVPELKQLKTKDEFTYLLKESKIEGATYSVRLDEVAIINETTALAYFHVNGYTIFTKEEIPARFLCRPVPDRHGCPH